MFDVLSSGFKNAKAKFSGHTTITADNVGEALAAVQTSLLDADVEYKVAKGFVARVKDKMLGQQVQLRSGKGSKRVHVNPADHFVKMCQAELEALMGEGDSSLQFPKQQPAIIMMVGLQGTGKTTSTGKLANYLRDKHKRKPLLVAADVYRPAARQQLQVLGDRLQLPVYSEASNDAVQICQSALKASYQQGCDTLLLDTAGRLAIDTKLMQELQAIKAAVHPTDVLFVCDAMMGQDAVATASSFHDALTLSGAIMTKLDGDARGGSALSIKEVTGVAIKFVGLGEGLEQLEEFRPEGLASRILGMGDIVGLMQDFERVADKEKEEEQEREALRMMRGRFNLKDFSEQIASLQKMGSMQDLVAKLPMQNLIPAGATANDKELQHTRVMIASMTERERLDPDIIDSSRVQRIAKGSGRSTSDVAALLKKFKQMRTMMGGLGSNLGLSGKIPLVKQVAQMRKMKEMLANPAAATKQFGAGKPTAASSATKVDRDKLKKMRRAAKAARRKNRRR